MKKKLMTAVLAATVAAVSIGGVQQANAFSLKDVLGGVVKVGGIGWAVDKYGASIDSFLNKILRQNNLSTTYATKVVPIVSIGSSGYIGAAQVTGPATEIEKVKAVAQVEASFNSVARVKGLVPVDNVNPTNASRIQGVGVSAIIDIRI